MMEKDYCAEADVTKQRRNDVTIRTGAELVATTKMLALAVAPLNAVVPPLVETSAVLPAVPLV